MFRLWERLGEGIQSQAGESGAGALRTAEPLRAAIKAGAKCPKGLFVRRTSLERVAGNINKRTGVPKGLFAHPL